MLFELFKGMKQKLFGYSLKGLLVGLMMLMISTPVSRYTGLSFDLASLNAPNKPFNCSQSEWAEISMGQFFEIRRALHFHQIIGQSLKKQNAKQRLSDITQLLDGVNRELLKPQDHFENSQLKSWIDGYPGSEKFKTESSYDLPKFYSYVESDVHEYFYSLMKETLLEKNIWYAKESNFSSKIRSLGVQLEGDTWARVGLYPKTWHLHIFKSPLNENKTGPREDFPVQSVSLKVFGPQHIELIDGSGQVKLKVKSPEDLELVPYCEWLAGEGNSERQARQRTLKNL